VKFLRDLLIIARHELADSLRSRRFIVILLLYVAGAMLVCNGFISALHKLEGQLSETLKLPTASSAGVVTEALWKSDTFRQMISHLVGDREVARELLTVPPIALIYAWVAFTFTPALIMLSTPARIAEEVGSGSARFVLCRTSRLAWCLGKFCGQALELVVVLMLSAVGAWLVARVRFYGADDAGLLAAMIIYGWKVWVYALAFIGLALAVSQACRSANLATVLAFVLLLGTIVLGALAQHYGSAGDHPGWELIRLLLPAGQRLALWRTSPVHVLPAMAHLAALGLVYLLTAHALFARKDV